MSSEPIPSSYNDILKSTSIVGGSQAINYVISMARTKLVALLLGPSGLGIVGLFQSSTTLVSQLSRLGIDSSGVRQIAAANGSGDSEYVGKTVRVLRLTCWATGILGWVITVCLSGPLSIWAFDSTENARSIAILGVTVFLVAISGGQRALLQGTRRIGDLARMTVISSLASTIVAVSIYAVWRERGIVAVLIVSAIVNLSISWLFARRVTVPTFDNLTWKETLREGKKLTSLGFAFMWAGSIAALVDLGIRALIVRDSGVEGTGIYQASWGLSGMFANFILGAMGTDFYPRLTAVTDDHEQMRSIVNEQIEIGSLIALPGLLATLAFGPLLMTIFYSEKFTAGAELLPWFVLGIYCKVISWPVGFTVLAKGAAKWFLITQTLFYAINILAVWLLIEALGLVGVGVAFFIAFIPAILGNLYVANRLTGFVWSKSVLSLVVVSGILVTVGFARAVLLPTNWNLGICVTLTCVASVLSIRGITTRIGREHRIVRMLSKVPGMGFILPK